MDKREFHSSSHIVFIDSDSLKAQRERLGWKTEPEVSHTVLEVLSVTVRIYTCTVLLYNTFLILTHKHMNKCMQYHLQMFIFEYYFFGRFVMLQSKLNRLMSYTIFAFTFVSYLLTKNIHKSHHDISFPVDKEL